MITKDKIQELLHNTETYRVERTTSTGDMDKFQEAICAFANDLPNSRKNGYLILGAYDNGTLSGLKVTDDLLKKIAAIRSNGRSSSRHSYGGRRTHPCRTKNVIHGNLRHHALFGSKTL